MILPVRDNRRLFWIIAVVAIILDQAIKAWARHAFADNLAALHSGPFPGFFEFTLTYNEGIAFGMFQGHGVFLAPVAVLMSGGAMWYSHRHPRDPILAHVAMGLLAAGALGNLYDRVMYGKVTDMFYFPGHQLPGVQRRRLLYHGRRGPAHLPLEHRGHGQTQTNPAPASHRRESIARAPTRTRV